MASDRAGLLISTSPIPTLLFLSDELLQAFIEHVKRSEWFFIVLRRLAVEQRHKSLVVSFELVLDVSFEPVEFINT